MQNDCAVFQLLFLYHHELLVVQLSLLLPGVSMSSVRNESSQGLWGLRESLADAMCPWLSELENGLQISPLTQDLLSNPVSGLRFFSTQSNCCLDGLLMLTDSPWRWTGLEVARLPIEDKLWSRNDLNWSDSNAKSLDVPPNLFHKRIASKFILQWLCCK